MEAESGQTEVGAKKSCAKKMVNHHLPTLVGGFKPSEKYNGWDDELLIWKNRIHVPVTTNQNNLDGKETPPPDQKSGIPTALSSAIDHAKELPILEACAVCVGGNTTVERMKAIYPVALSHSYRKIIHFYK